jgi:hypothetical protein
LGSGSTTGLGVDGQNGGQIFGYVVRHGSESLFHHCRQRKKRDVTVEKRRDGNLVGGIVNGRGTAAGGHGGLGEAQHGVTGFVHRAEVE